MPAPLEKPAARKPSGRSPSWRQYSLPSPVTAGARISSFFWIQSMVRDDGQRSLLFDLDMAINRLRGDLPAYHPSPVGLTAVYHNLLRKWTEL